MPKYLSIDTETTGLSVYKGDRPFAIGIADNETESYYEFNVDPFSRNVLVDDAFYDTDIYKRITDPSIDKIFHNAKFDLSMLSAIGVSVKGKLHDSYVAARCTFNGETSYKLKYLAKKYCGIDDKDEKDLQQAVLACRKMAKTLGFKIADKPEMDYWLPSYFGKGEYCEKYCKLDCRRTYDLFMFFREGVKEMKQDHIYKKEMALIPVLQKIEKRGVLIDLDITKQLLKDTQKEAEQHSNNFDDLCLAEGYHGVKITSSKQLQKLLYEDLDLPSTKLTPKGSKSTDNQSLKDIAEHHQIIPEILQYRAKVKGCEFFENYLYYQQDSVIHCNFNQLGATTGRLSCSNPNLQNVANPETSGNEYVVNGRLPFIPRKDYVWYSLDYKQLEGRIFASLAKDEKLIELFSGSADPFEAIGERIWKDSIPKGRRRKLSKNVFYTKIFAGGPKVLNQKYGVPYGEAQLLFQDFDGEFPRSKEFAHELIWQIKKEGYIINAYGRKIFVDPDFAYVGLNYMIQSSAADLMKLALLRIDRYLEEQQIDAHIVLTIHDEIDIEYHNSVDRKHILPIKELMEDHLGVFDLELPVEIAVCKENWYKKEKVAA